MKNVFVETSNVKKFHGAISALNQRGAAEACLVVVDGLPGLGKTTTLRNWVAQTGSVYLRAQQGWTENWFLSDLLKAMDVHPPHSLQQKAERVRGELALRQSNALFTDHTFSVVIDEADYVSRREKIIETIRGLSDSTEIPFILVGMGKINDNLVRFPQVTSRVSQRVKFERSTKDDVRALMAGRCDMPVADDLVTFLHKASGGYNREILEAIANIERFGKRNPPGPDGLTLADMAGQVLLNDRASSKPILVPEVY
ncbi:ATP-binding protein [Flexibacterium corallicola]|uniref:ATP-binding protein n=1 Tax=Flexibacterium corallicola TaxID=3037259 RepID=UPI00286EF031|nr:ATP-binding protein [Pseudovibrio sp. M1P-2-3]